MYESESDLMEFRESIRENIIEAFKTILNTCDKLKLYTDEEGEEYDCRVSIPQMGDKAFNALKSRLKSRLKSWLETLNA